MMYARIMTPVDLANPETQRRALDAAADLAKLYDIEVVYVGVTTAAPGAVAATPEAFAAQLDALAKEEGARRGHRAGSYPLVTQDPTSDLDAALMAAQRELGADLVVMATHAPNLADYLWPSNGGKLASHSEASVYLVRP